MSFLLWIKLRLIIHQEDFGVGTLETEMKKIGNGSIGNKSDEVD